MARIPVSQRSKRVGRTKRAHRRLGRVLFLLQEIKPKEEGLKWETILKEPPGINSVKDSLMANHAAEFVNPDGIIPRKEVGEKEIPSLV